MRALTDAFKAIGEQFSAANGGAAITFNFAGSDAGHADRAGRAGRCVCLGEYKAAGCGDHRRRDHQRHRAHLCAQPAGAGVPAEQPRQAGGVAGSGQTRPQDRAGEQARAGGRLRARLPGQGLAAPEYTAAYSPTVLANVVSYEESVKAVLGKIVLGEADAGIVYTTDTATVKDGSIGTLAIPDNLNTIAAYPIAATKNAKNPGLARKFIDALLSSAGRQILVKYGFISSGSTNDAAPGGIGRL
ncbi:MAG: extracellular solute-binding protein [Kouleothrix sp.]